MKNRIAYLVILHVSIVLCGCHLFKKDVTRKITYHVYMKDDKQEPHTLFADSIELDKFYVYVNSKGCVIDYDSGGWPTLYLSRSDTAYNIDTIERTVERSLIESISESPYYFIKDSSIHDQKWGNGTLSRICTPLKSEKTNDTICNITVCTSDIKLPRGAATDIIRRAGFMHYSSETALIRLDIVNHFDAGGNLPARNAHGICEIQSIEDLDIPDRISQVREYLKKFKSRIR